MKAIFSAALLFLAASAYAQDDEAIPYPDEEEEDKGRKKLPRHSEETYTPREETEYEQEERERPLAGIDDPNVGFAGELLVGALLADSASGSFPSARFSWGIRATWEIGRTVGAESFKDNLFADVTWAYSGNKTGTERVFSDTNLHYFTLAPAYAPILFGPDRIFAFYLQAGLGIAYNATAITVADARTEVSGVKPLFQYGLGIRGTPTVNRELPLRISFRAELTRFRRGYADDTLIGGSVGVDF